MSERNWARLIMVAAMTVAFGIGLWDGMAYMKRWQDSYYAAHPVVKATYVPVHNDLASGECALLGGKWRNVADPMNEGNEWLCLLAPAPPKKAKPAKAISAHEALSPIFNMLDVETTKHLTKFYVTIPYVEGHWEIMATDRVNAILRLGSTSWTESEWDSCSVCKESRPVEVVSRERWLKEHCYEKVGDMYIEKPCPAAKP